MGQPTGRTSRRTLDAGAGLATLAIGAVLRLGVGPPHKVSTDHTAFLGTVRRMRGGTEYYTAFQKAFLEDVNIRISQARSYREPLLFVVWRWIPSGALYAAFLAMAALAAWLIARASTTPVAGLAAGVYLVVASRTSIEEWMLVEMWCALPLAAVFLAWRRERFGWAAGCAAIAVLVRELCVVVLVAGLVVSFFRKRKLTPWLVAGAVGAVGIYLHGQAAADHLLDHGTDAQLLGTGHPPATMFAIVHWPFPVLTIGAWILVAAWALAAVALLAPRAPIEPVHALLALPVAGLFVERPYWGLVATPFALALAVEVLTGRRAASRPAEQVTPGNA